MPIEYKTSIQILIKDRFYIYKYQLSDLSILIDKEKLTANSEKELKKQIITEKGNDFGTGPWPYKPNDNLLNKKRQGSIKSAKTILEHYGVLMTYYFTVSSRIKELNNLIRKSEASKKSIFDKDYIKYKKTLRNLKKEKKTLTAEFDSLSKTSWNMKTAVLKQFNADKILAYAYKHAIAIKVQKLFEKSNKVKESSIVIAPKLSTVHKGRKKNLFVGASVNIQSEKLLNVKSLTPLDTKKISKLMGDEKYQN